MISESRENNVPSPERLKDNKEEKETPLSVVEHFRMRPSFNEQAIDTYAKAIHSLVESDPSPQVAQKALDAHLKIMQTLGNAREVLDAIANTRAEKERKEEGQSTFTEDIVALNKIIQAEKERAAREETAIKEQREILGIAPGHAKEDESLRNSQVAEEKPKPPKKSFFRRLFGG